MVKCNVVIKIRPSIYLDNEKKKHEKPDSLVSI